MRRHFVPSALWLLAVVAFVGGAALVVAAQWTRPLLEGDQALRDGALDVALAKYAVGEARFNRLPATKQILNDAYHGAVANELRTQYQLKQYDALIEKAAVSPPTAATHFWTGCALFEKARTEQDGQARIGWLSRADEEFHSALELESDDWDTKFNYELTRRLLNELRKQPKTPPSQLMQLLRPQPRGTGQPARRVG
jgi:hypothetical protein